MLHTGQKEHKQENKQNSNPPVCHETQLFDGLKMISLFG